MLLHTKLDSTTMYCFGNVLFNGIVPNHEPMNRDIMAFLNDERRLYPEKRGRAINGWRSKSDLFERRNPAIDRLADYVRNAIGAVATRDAGQGITDYDVGLRMELWANIVGHGGSGALHCHMGGGETHYSGVYYVDVEGGDREVDENGSIEFVDPRCIPWLALPEDEGHGSHRTLGITPRNGMLLVFPSWLNHQVKPWHSHAGAERTSLSFNVTLSIREKQSAGSD